MRVVVDTNVWVSGLIRPDGTAGRVLIAIRTGLVEPVVSWELAAELAEVVRRPKLERYEISAEQVGELLVVLSRWLPSVDVEPELRDPKDAPVVSAAVAGGAEAIVTGDLDLLENNPLRAWLGERGVAVLRPAELLEELDRHSGRP